MNKRPVDVKDHFKTARELVTWLNKEGYLACDNSGNANYNLEAAEVNFLKPVAQPKRSLNLGFFKITLPNLNPRRGIFIGTIHNLSLNEWILDVRGYDNLDEMTQLAERMQEEFDVFVQVTLIRHDLQYESFDNEKRHM